MSDAPTNYRYWDHTSLIDTFNNKSVTSFFASETRFLDTVDVPALHGVLDVGCSCGRFIELLRSRGYRSHYTGVDVSDAAIQICRANYPESDFYSGNYFDVTPSRTHELVNATGVVQHEPEYQRLIAKMIGDSSRYVLFDVKLANVSDAIVDVERCYCQIGASRIHMICFSFRHLMDFLLELPGCGEVSAFGYHTPHNSATRGPSDVINNWVSCGVFIDRHRPRGLAHVDVPADLDLR